MERMWRLVIHGKVQGVGFRYTVRRFAQDQDLKGTVKNLPDGTVEIIIIGGEQHLRIIRNFCASSPGASEVEYIDTKEIGEELKERYKEVDSFEMLY